MSLKTSYGKKLSIVGIAANVLLAAFKAAVGLVAGSIAIVMDAVNNLSDALSSVITIVGTKLSARPADREHPFGHGRVEYLTAIVIALIVSAAGVTSLVESVQKLFNPSVPSYSTVTLVVIIVAIAVKLVSLFTIHNSLLYNNFVDEEVAGLAGRHMPRG